MGSLPDERRPAAERLAKFLGKARKERYWNEAHAAMYDLFKLEATIERQRQLLAWIADNTTEAHIHHSAAAALFEGDSGPNLQDPMAAAEMLHEGDSK